MGRDYTTVSRQVAKLEILDLVERRESVTDRRVRQAIVTPKGKVMTDLVDAAREKIGRGIFETWDMHEMDELVRLMRKFADAVSSEQPVGSLIKNSAPNNPGKSSNGFARAEFR